MRPWMVAAFVVITCVVIGIWLSGLRIFIIQPIGAIPKGVTAIVINIRGINFVDSPDAVCIRQGSPNLLCRGMVAAKVAQEGTIIARLPFSSTLYSMSGAPDLSR